MTQPASHPTVLSRLRLGSAPDSWGVWFPDDPQQTPWHRFLDELVEAGYSWLELGPFGYLPTDAQRLKDELGRRGLRLSGGTVFAGLHRQGGLEECVVEARQVAATLQELGAGYLVLLPEMIRDSDEQGTFLQPYQLDGDQWQRLTTDMDQLGRIVAEEFGLSLVFHPHADSHIDVQDRVERLLESTDPTWTNLCLDTGHLTYCGGDNLDLVGRYPERIRYVHVKQVSPSVLEEVRAQDLSFAEAVRRGVMVEPPTGIPEMEPLLAELDALDADLFAIVEQDLYPCAPDVPLPIAARTRAYLGGCGLGPGPRPT
jgi:inosose dehydratase